MLSNIFCGNYDVFKTFLVTLYLKPLCKMHYKSSFNALIMPCNAPYDALYMHIMNNCNHG